MPSKLLRIFWLVTIVVFWAAGLNVIGFGPKEFNVVAIPTALIVMLPTLVLGIFMGLDPRKSGMSSILILSILALIVCIGGTIVSIKVAGGIGIYTMVFWAYIGAIYILLMTTIAAIRATFVLGIFKGLDQGKSGHSSMLILSLLAFIVCIVGIIINLKGVEGWGGFYTILFWAYIDAIYILVLAIIAATRAAAKMVNRPHNKKGLETTSEPPLLEA